MPAFEVDNAENEESRDGGIELPAADKLDITDDNDDCALDTEAATAVKPARFVIVLRSPVKVSGIDLRAGSLKTIEVAKAGGMGSGVSVGVAAASEAEEEKAAAAAN